jgi:hypothetical protein
MLLEKLNEKIDNFNFRIVSISLIILGISIRIYHFLLNRSLWLDEAMLSNNIVNRDYLQLLQPLDERQIAPIGFLMVQKFLVNTFGVSEYSLRAFPTLAGIISIIFFYLLFRKIAGEKIACAGLLFFIFGKLLIYHSTEAKQYYMDVFVYILAFYYLYFKTPDFRSLKSIISTGLGGAVLIWFSHCTIFFLASIGFALAVEIIYSRKFKSIAGFLTMCSIWIISFGINFYFFLFNHSSQTIQESAFMAAGYLPPEGPLKDVLLWFFPLLKKSVTYPFNISSLLPLVLLICLGIWYVFKNKKYRFLTLALPFLIHIILSFLYIYPFGGRFNLYLGTIIILFIVLGLKAMALRVKVIGMSIAIFALLLIIYQPARYSFVPVEFEEMKPALKYIQEHRNENDVIYIHFPSLPSYRFYKDKYPLGESVIFEGSPGLPGFDRDFESIINYDIVWLMLTHFDDSEKSYIMEKCNREGKLIEQYEYGGALTLLYSFADK